MALKAVIGEEPPQIGVARKQNAVEVVGFALEPIRSGEQADDARHGRARIGLGADANAMVQPRAQEMIDDLETLLALGIVHPANVDEAAEAAAWVVAQDLNNLGNVVARDGERELAEFKLGALEFCSEAVAEIGGELVKGVGHWGSRRDNCRISVRWCRSAGFSFAAAARRKRALRPSADSPLR